MAAITPKSGKQQGKRTAANPPPRTAPSGEQPEVVDPIWLLKGIGVVIVAALICGYLTLCLLFYQGQWQLVLHPDRSKPVPSSIAGQTVETVRFGVDDSGAPQLSGWWIAAPAGGRYATETMLYLPSGDGSLADAQAQLAALHTLGINIFAFDYRGYGPSAATHPDQRRMTEDSNSAWQYLTVSRSIPAARILPYGDGVGAYLAVQLAANHQQIPGVVLQAPRTDLIRVVLDDPRTQSLPVRALFHDSFDLSAPLAALKAPKLFLVSETSPAVKQARDAVDPKTVVILPKSEATGPAAMEQIARFLDQNRHN